MTECIGTCTCILGYLMMVCSKHGQRLPTVAVSGFVLHVGVLHGANA